MDEGGERGWAVVEIGEDGTRRDIWTADGYLNALTYKEARDRAALLRTQDPDRDVQVRHWKSGTTAPGEVL